MARVLRKHSRLCVRSLAIALASVSFLVVASFRSPERQAEGPDQSRLVAPLVLIGETGGPKWNNIQTVFGETAICHETSKHTYELVAPGLGLAELMTDSRCDRYRLEAEVRHDETQSPNGGRVGIYFSRTKQESPGKPVHCMAALAYSDFRPENAALIRPAGETTIRPSNMVSLSLQRRPPSQDGEGGARATILQHFFDPPDPVPSPRPWRRLAIEVTPERMRAYWDDQLVGEKTIDYIVHRARNYPDFRHDPLDPIPAFGPHGGLGLYVYRGTASFRNVIIRPLDDVR